MKALIVGLGSIGTRHARNLAALGHEVLGFDPAEARRAACAFPTVDDLPKGLAARCNFAVIASPNRYHVEQAMAAASAGLHLFIEKPLAVSSQGLAALREAADRNGLCSLVGSNWKFHPALAEAKRLVESGEIGDPLAVQAVGGQYLPDWHPWEDYRRGYSARLDLDGGALFDSHEVDLLTWLLGPVASVNCRIARSGTLDIETEDLVCMTLAFRSRALGTLQLDYLQHPYCRRIHITGSRGTLVWDALENEVVHYSAADKRWHRWKTPLAYEINQMYVEEMRHFTSCIEGAATSWTPLGHAAHVVAIYDAARASSSRGGAPQEVAA